MTNSTEGWVWDRFLGVKDLGKGRLSFGRFGWGVKHLDGVVVV